MKRSIVAMMRPLFVPRFSPAFVALVLIGQKLFDAGHSIWAWLVLVLVFAVQLIAEMERIKIEKGQKALSDARARLENMETTIREMQQSLRAKTALDRNLTQARKNAEQRYQSLTRKLPK